jgi:gephyrin
LLEKEASGLTVAMLVNSLQITPLASLSRPVCGVRQNTLIITLPGSVKGCTENLACIQSVLGHALELCRGEIMLVQNFARRLTKACMNVHITKT